MAYNATMNNAIKTKNTEAGRLREKYGLTQAKAAELTHLSIRQWRRLESKEALPALYADLLTTKTLWFTPKK